MATQFFHNVLILRYWQVQLLDAPSSELHVHKVLSCVFSCLATPGLPLRRSDSLSKLPPPPPPKRVSRGVSDTWQSLADGRAALQISQNSRRSKCFKCHCSIPTLT